MVGLRGVGKTVLLDRMRMDAEAAGMRTVSIEATEERSLPAMLAPSLRQTLLRLSANERARALARRALQGLSGFVGALKVKYADIEVGIDLPPEPGLADNGDLEQDLTSLFEVIGAAAKEARSTIAMFIDELQYVREAELAALITALHRTSQLQLPLVLVGAGLPQLRGRAGKAKSYAERLFDFPEVGPLGPVDARRAIELPALAEDTVIEEPALDRIVWETRGYPYFLQEWGKHAWEVADASPIGVDDVARGSVLARAALDEGFFRVRFDRLTPAEKRYLRAMAELGAGPHRSGDIAAVLRKQSPSLGLTRGNLISKGMIWSPNHGDTAFTVPLFDQFMVRAMPDDDWRSA